MFLFIILFIAFILFSVIYMKSGNKIETNMVSENLTQNVWTENNIRYIEYVDANGHLQFASDKKYAKCMEMLDSERRVIYEKFYDENENLMTRENGAYGKRYEYYPEQDGYMAKITYEDLSEKPMVVASGYTIALEYYNDNDEKIASYYFDQNMNPVVRKEGYFGEKKVYDKGNIIEISYIDTSGNLVKNSSGYAKVVQTYYNDGNIKCKKFFDVNNDPIALGLNQYGEKYEYDSDGRVSQITYLNANGEADITNKGYASIRKTYDSEWNIKTVKYYGKDGEPYQVDYKTYGFLYDGNLKIPLGRDGFQRISFNTILKKVPLLVIIGGILYCLFLFYIPKKIKIVGVAGYLGFILYETLLFRKMESGNIELRLFWSYMQIFSDRSLGIEIIENIWLFIPLGAGLYMIFQKRSIVIGSALMISSTIEVMQFLFGLGLCELDDIFSNALGGIVGMVFAMILINEKNVGYNN